MNGRSGSRAKRVRMRLFVGEVMIVRIIPTMSGSGAVFTARFDADNHSEKKHPEIAFGMFFSALPREDYLLLLCISLASMVIVVCGTARRRSLGISLPVTLQIP